MDVACVLFMVLMVPFATAVQDVDFNNFVIDDAIAKVVVVDVNLVQD